MYQIKSFAATKPEALHLEAPTSSPNPPPKPRSSPQEPAPYARSHRESSPNAQLKGLGCLGVHKVQGFGVWGLGTTEEFIVIMIMIMIMIIIIIIIIIIILKNIHIIITPSSVYVYSYAQACLFSYLKPYKL